MASNYINLPAVGSASWKSPVATALSLPALGNSQGDVRIALDTGVIYAWIGSMWIAESGGGVTSLNALTGSINLVAGANIVITPGAGIITIAAPGSGITRSVNSISSNTTLGAGASIDYVYFVSGTTTATLPTAVGNTNRYTVKNTGVGVVTLNTTGGQTIDGSASASLPVANTSLDLISNGANWHVV